MGNNLMREWGTPDVASGKPLRVQSETEHALRSIFPDPDSQARADLIFGECVRAVEAQAAIDREDIRRAAEGR